jgi:hypothetical protein
VREGAAGRRAATARAAPGGVSRGGALRPRAPPRGASGGAGAARPLLKTGRAALPPPARAVRWEVIGAKSHCMPWPRGARWRRACRRGARAAAPRRAAPLGLMQGGGAGALDATPRRPMAPLSGHSGAHCCFGLGFIGGQSHSRLRTYARDKGGGVGARGAPAPPALLATKWREERAGPQRRRRPRRGAGGRAAPELGGGRERGSTKPARSARRGPREGPTACGAACRGGGGVSKVGGEDAARKAKRRAPIWGVRGGAGAGRGGFRRHRKSLGSHRPRCCGGIDWPFYRLAVVARPARSPKGAALCPVVATAARAPGGVRAAAAAAGARRGGGGGEGDAPPRGGTRNRGAARATRVAAAALAWAGDEAGGARRFVRGGGGWRALIAGRCLVGEMGGRIPGVARGAATGSNALRQREQCWGARPGRARPRPPF